MPRILSNPEREGSAIETDVVPPADFGIRPGSGARPERSAPPARSSDDSVMWSLIGSSTNLEPDVPHDRMTTAANRQPCWLRPKKATTVWVSPGTGQSPFMFSGPFGSR